MLWWGIDRVKDERLLIPAYDDSQGITAEFNLNLLRRINRELDGDIPVDAFRHAARWNNTESRVEMHLEAKRAVAFAIGSTPFRMLAGETIHTSSATNTTRAVRFSFCVREDGLPSRNGAMPRIYSW